LTYIVESLLYLNTRGYLKEKHTLLSLSSKSLFFKLLKTVIMDAVDVISLSASLSKKKSSSFTHENTTNKNMSSKPV
ncbi:hypothetical protein J9332_44240, partial [Aquimarina celericrescens]|nr:hypothetical protein [Aquimarina celericrescens]